MKKTWQILNKDEKLWWICLNKPQFNRSYILHHPYWTLIIGGSGSGKTNMTLSLIKHQISDVDLIFYTSKIYSNQSIN